MQWQNSLDTGKTWKDVPGETSNTYAVPRRSSGVITYRVVVAERANINSLGCRIASNAIYTEIYPLPPHQSPQNLLGCLDKNLLLPLVDPSALQALWNGPNGYSSNQFSAVVPAVQYRDTGLYTLQSNFSFGCVDKDSFYVHTNAF